MSLIDTCKSPPHRAALRLLGVAMGGPVHAQLLTDLKHCDPVALARIINANNIHTVISGAQGRNERLDAALPDDFWLYMRDMTAANAERLLAGKRDLEKIGRTFLKAEIPAVVLKGGADILASIHHNPARRFTSDLDILVPADRCREAIDLLADPERHSDPYRFHYSTHHLPSIYPTGCTFPVEIHFRVGQPIVASLLKPCSVFAASRPSPVPGLLLPALLHRFLHHTLHHAVHYRDQMTPGLRGIFEHCAFTRSLDPADLADAKALLEAADLDQHLKRLEGLTSTVLGHPSETAGLAEARWLRRSMYDFGRPRTRLTYFAKRLGGLVQRCTTSRLERRVVLQKLSDTNYVRNLPDRWRRDLDRNR